MRPASVHLVVGCAIVSLALFPTVFDLSFQPVRFLAGCTASSVGNVFLFSEFFLDCFGQIFLCIVGDQESWVLLVLSGDMLNGVDDGRRDLCSVYETVYPDVSCCSVDYRHEVIGVVCGCWLYGSTNIR